MSRLPDRLSATTKSSSTSPPTPDANWRGTPTSACNPALTFTIKTEFELTTAPRPSGTANNGVKGTAPRWYHRGVTVDLPRQRRFHRRHHHHRSQRVVPVHRRRRMNHGSPTMRVLVDLRDVGERAGPGSSDALTLLRSELHGHPALVTTRHVRSGRYGLNHRRRWRHGRQRYPGSEPSRESAVTCPTADVG